MSAKLPKGINANGQSVLVAGAAGFLGSHFVDALIETGAKIIGIDDFTTGKKENIEHFKKHPNFNFIEASINESLPKTLYKESISHIVHVANIETYLGQEKLELNQLLANSFGVKNLLDLAVANRSTFLFTSSIDIYAGLASRESLKHYYDGAETETRFSYLEAKRYAEALSQQYVDLYDLDVRIARLSEVYGPRMNLETNSLLARLIRLTLQGKDLIIDEEGSREHVFCFVTDVVYGLNKLLFASGEEVQKSIFYFANPERVSTLSIAYTLREYVGFDIKVEFMPAKKPFLPIKTRKVDISRSQRELYWEPKVDLSEGLRLTLEWFRSNLPKPPKFPKLPRIPPTGTQLISEIEAAQVEDTKKQIGKRLKRPAVEESKIKLLKKPSFFQKLRFHHQSQTTSHKPPITNHQPVKGWLSLIKKPLPRDGFTLKGVESAEAKERKVKKHLKLSAAALVGVLLFGPPFLTCVFAGKTAYDLNQAKTAIFSQNSLNTHDNLNKAQTNLLRTQKYLRYSRFLLALFGQKQRLTEIDKTLTAGFFALDAAKMGSDAFFVLSSTFEKVKKFSPLFGGIRAGEKQQINLADARLGLRLASKRASLAAEELLPVDEKKLCLGNFLT
ncbi:MAG: NAD-dependent epimerase/dehydratase family protein, partial [Candidatus Cloacimonetes bacterium]|nr:NAD-dependent epimerase/dehydratase family protein [Candidatus Cloacimonadota bacterium]